MTTELAKREVELIHYEEACRAVAAAHRIDEVKKIHDQMEAVRVYAKQAKNFTLQNQAAEIRIRAQRRAGELLEEMKKNKEREGRGGDRKSNSRSKILIPKLEDLGLSPDQSSKAQKLSKIPQASFDKAISKAQAEFKELTTAAVLRVTSNGSKPKQKRSTRRRVQKRDPIAANPTTAIKFLIKHLEQHKVDVVRLKDKLTRLHTLIGEALAGEKKPAAQAA